MRILFICNQGKNRSRTAEEIFKDRFETKSAGLYSQTPVSEREIGWADLVVVMEEEQRKELAKRFPKTYLKKQIICLDIHDSYYHNQTELKKILEDRIKELMSSILQTAV